MKSIPRSRRCKQRSAAILSQSTAFRDENLCIIGNEEAKVEEDWRVSRALRDEAGNIYDVLAGRAFVCAVDDENFIGLNDDQIQTIMASYRYPEHVLMTSSGLVALPYPEPEIDAEFEMGFE